MIGPARTSPRVSHGPGDLTACNQRAEFNQAADVRRARLQEDQSTAISRAEATRWTQ